MEELNIIWILVAAFLVFLMQAGFTMVETGYVRAKNSVNIAMKNVLDFIIATIFFYFIGFALMFGNESVALFGFDLYILKPIETPKDLTIFVFQLMFAGTAATIVSGAVAERISFKGYALISLFVTALIYPISGHWVWNEHGWLYDLGYVDFAGSSVVHLLGACVGMVGTMIIGARHGRFDEEGNPVSIPHFNLTLVTLGTFLLWFGWFGFNGGSTLEANDQIPLIITNTIMAGAFGGFGAFVFSVYKEKQASVSKMLNGVLGGLVGITAACNLTTPLDSVFIGIISGVIVCIGEDMLIKFKIDDPVGAIPVHGICGIFGVLAVALFGDIDALPAHDRLEQLWIQTVGFGSIMLWGFLSAFIAFWLLKKFHFLRVPLEDEIIGLNIAEHGIKMSWFDTLVVIRDIINEGDYSKRVDVEQQTEAGEVAENFNRLLDDLEKNIHVIDQVSRGELGEASAYRPKGEADKLGISIERMVKNLKEMMDTLKNKSSELERFNKNLEKMVLERTLEVKERNEKISTLLNSSGEGFLSFGKNRRVDSEYSAECESIFQTKIANRDIAALFYADDALAQKAYKNTLDLLFDSKDDLQKEVLLSLVDSEFVLHDKNIKAEYRLLEDNKIMVILTDITEQRILEKRIIQERKLLQFVAMLIKEKQGFFGALEEFTAFLGSFKEHLVAAPKIEISYATGAYRRFHTYKGVFLQFEMPTLPKALHEIEDLLWREITHAQKVDHDVLLDASVLDAVFSAKDEDIAYIRNALGNEFLESGNAVSLPKSYVNILEGFAKNIEQKIDPEQTDDALKQGMEVIKKLRYTSFKNLLHSYTNLCIQLSTKLEKEIEPFEIEGDDVLVDPKRYEEFTRALVHIFRNAIDHGIEDYETRLDAGKSEIATIGCSVKEGDENIIIEIKDDGAGIDTERIKAVALKKGLYDAGQLADMDAEAIYAIMFEDGFSTKGEVSDISGRGVGLPTLKEECDKIGGTIEIESIPGEGSCFRFILPKE